MKKLVTFFSILLFANSSFAATPKEYAESIADKVVSIIESPKSEKAREDDLIALFKKNVDTDWMGKFTMGRHFRQADKSQQRKFLDLYRDYVIYSYIPKFRLYAGERMMVTQVIEEGNGYFTVKSTLKTTASSTGSVFVDYKLKQTGGNYKIIDVIGEGVSLINTQRSDFTTPLASMGIDGFISRLEEKVKALKANPPETVKESNAESKMSGVEPAAGK